MARDRDSPPIRQIGSAWKFGSEGKRQVGNLGRKLGFRAVNLARSLEGRFADAGRHGMRSVKPKIPSGRISAARFTLRGSNSAS